MDEIKFIISKISFNRRKNFRYLNSKNPKVKGFNEYSIISGRKKKEEFSTRTSLAFF